MARPKLRGVLLCEDTEHERFFRRLLIPRWFARNKLKVQRIPDGKGAGDAFVVDRYVEEVRLARRWRNENYGLAVAVDGDLLKLEGRLRQLDQRLAEAGLEPRSEEERIAVFVPTRSIETWELWLCGRRDLDEDSDYKSRFRKAQRRGTASAKDAVDAWFRSLSPEEDKLERETLPALAAGRVEVRRLGTSRS